MFNRDFYPTPETVINLMGIDCHNKTVLEPSAGKGNIVNWLNSNGAKKVLTCEKHKDLAEIVKTKSQFIKYDFLEVKPEEISHIDCIVMNPPFSEGDKHILHAWETAPSGCEIVSLLNYSNIDNKYTKSRKQLDRLINDYGDLTNLGNVFNEAERTTDVEVALIKLYKPKAEEKEWEGFFMEEEIQEEQGEGIMKFNFVRDVVQRYINSVKCFEEHLAISYKMNQLNAPFKVGSFSFEISHNNKITNKEDYKKELQKKAWRYLFDKMNMERFLTSGVIQEVNTFVEKQSKIPFTMKNIYHMFDVIVGTSEQTFNKAIVEAIDKFTRHTHENRFAVEGWKTNEGHLLNPKFIIPYIVEPRWGGEKMTVKIGSRYTEHLTDLVKVICSLEGKNYDDIVPFDRFVNYRYKLMQGDKFINKVDDYLWGFSDEFNDLEKTRQYAMTKGIICEVEDSYCDFGKWCDWGFFQIKGFKKGTLHVKFKDPKVWERLNRRYAHIKGQVLPEKFRI